MKLALPLSENAPNGSCERDENSEAILSPRGFSAANSEETVLNKMKMVHV